MELVVFLVSLFGFLALGIPIAIVLVLCSMVLMYYGGMWDSMFVMIIPQSMLDGANNYPLMAIPFFVFAGEIMTEGGLSKRVVKLAQLIIGRVRGGLGYAAIVSSVIFAGLMGSSVGEAAALGSLLLPMMAQAGYKPGRAGGVIASGAILGPIIPPSTNFILLGATVGLSITKLFMIGLVPGLIIGLCLMVTWFFIVRIDGYKEKIEFKKGEASKIVRDAMPAFMMPVLLLGGIRFGVFTPTEGGAFACVYAIAVCTLYYRELTFKGLLAVVGLRDEQFVGFDAKAPGIGHVKRVLGVDEGGGPAELLAFRDDVQGEGRFARGFGAVDFGDPALGDASDAEGEVYADGPGGDHRDFDMDIIGKLHHGALAEFAFDGFEGCFQRLLARFFRGKGWLFCHWGRLHKGRRGLPG